MDDEDDAVADDGTVDVDDPHLLENRGWSVRTRLFFYHISIVCIHEMGNLLL